MSEQEQDEWDPVKDVFGYERDNYVDLFKYFLMLEDEDSLTEWDGNSKSETAPQDGNEPQQAEKSLSKSAKKRTKKANAQMKKLEPDQQDSEGRGADTIAMETRKQLRERLSKPIKLQRESGWYAGPEDLERHYPALSDEEIDNLQEEISEVKNYLFCRILLSQASLLPVALQANSIEEFLSHNQVTQEHIRDICLKLERPPLQDVRDACADFIRAEEENPDDEDLGEQSDNDYASEDEEEERRKKYALVRGLKDGVPRKYQTKREKAAKKQREAMKQVMGGDDATGILDFPDVTDESDYRRKKMRIKICGRNMYNYPSEKALNRGGWYRFSIIAKDSDLYDAIQLCRNWNELFELNILCIYHYFPAEKWTRLSGDLMRQQLLQLGLFLIS
ncbi:hypothetical protein K491DRAFT_777340 [Lophiostoma macrostomum CBS 122681]|uniref:Uncharacterized protein n=1 Tax=Lophiostoma macrostomum CBS 122681 TaxID=1314788 RepID=A0A6A6TF23_9PLEO|nr:hypothetical protein K491DRAFT_777340 [Lophiostoma macrostomum CBS 122681]